MPSDHTPVRDVGGGGGTTVHGQGGDAPRADENTDPLPGPCSRAYRSINDYINVN